MFQKLVIRNIRNLIFKSQNAKRMLNHGFIPARPTVTQILPTFRGSETVQNQSNEVKPA